MTVKMQIQTGSQAQLISTTSLLSLSSTVLLLWHDWTTRTVIISCNPDHQKMGSCCWSQHCHHSSWPKASSTFAYTCISILI